MLTRRFFLAASAGSLVSLGLPLTAQATMLSDAAMKLGIDPVLKEKCDVMKDGRFITHLKLVGLEQPFATELKVAQYILNFEAAIPVILPESSYQVSHPLLGRIDLFLQPCGSFNNDQHNGIQYRACMAMLR